MDLQEALQSLLGSSIPDQQQSSAETDNLRHALQILCQQRDLLEPQLVSGDANALQRHTILQQQIQSLQSSLLLPSSSSSAAAKPVHSQLALLQSNNAVDSPWSAFSLSPPMSPFSSPPQSPLPAHFRKHADGVSPSASPYPAIHNKAIAKTQHLDANRKGSAAKSTSSGGGGSSGSADEKTLAIRRRKHNELEIKRRKKMNEKYEELCQLLGCSHTRLGILETAISKIKSADAQVRALNIILDATKKDLNHSHSSNSKAVSSTDFSFNLPALNETPVLASSANEIITKMSNSIRELKCPAMITALNGSILSFNSAVPKMLGFSDEILTKSTLFSVISEADLSKMFALTNRVLSGEVSSEVIDLKMVHSQGYTVSLRSFITAIFHKAAQKTTSIESSLFESQELSVPSEKIIALLLLFTVENETI